MAKEWYMRGLIRLFQSATGDSSKTRSGTFALIVKDFLEEKPQLLLVRYHNERGYYLPGGDIRTDETKKEGLSRLVREQLGSQLLFTGEPRQTGPGLGIRNDTDEAYLLPCGNGEITLSPGIAEYRWIDQQTISEVEFSWSPDRARRIVQMVFYGLALCQSPRHILKRSDSDFAERYGQLMICHTGGSDIELFVRRTSPWAEGPYDPRSPEGKESQYLLSHTEDEVLLWACANPKPLTEGKFTLQEWVEI